MTNDDIIRMALAAGLERDGDNFFSRNYDQIDVHIDDLKRFAEIVAKARDEKWKQAVIDELICCHIYNATHDNDPRKALHDAISWNVQAALDPEVSSDAQALIDRGKADEREECAKLCEQSDRYRGEYFAALIRKRAVEAKLKEKTNDKTKTLGTD